MTQIKNTIIEEKRRLILCAASVFIFGLIAHAYCFLNLNLSYDSLNEFFLSGQMYYTAGTVWQWKLSLGRFIVPLYQFVFRGTVLTPWLIGVLSLFWLSLAVWFTCRALKIEKPVVVFLTGGIFTVNLAVTALAATYTGDLDVNMFAVFMAACGAYCWSLGSRKRFWAILFAFIVLGIYQCMISVMIVIIMLVCIMRLLSSNEAKNVITNGFAAIGMLVAAGILYYAAVRLSCRLFNIDLFTGYNGLTSLWTNNGNSLPSLVLFTYRYYLNAFLHPASVSADGLMFAVSIVILAISVAFNVHISFLKGLRPSNRLLIIVLTLLLPLGMNITCVLDRGMVHSLMTYAFPLTYLSVLLKGDYICSSASKDSEQKTFKALYSFSVIMIAVCLWAGSQFANTAYVKKDLEEQTTLSTMTQVVDRINLTEGYIPGVTPVAFIGAPNQTAISPFLSLYEVTGLDTGGAVPNSNYYGAYFTYILKTPIKLCSSDVSDSLACTPEVFAMPVFPSAESMQWIGDTLVVRLS